MRSGSITMPAFYHVSLYQGVLTGRIELDIPVLSSASALAIAVQASGSGISVNSDLIVMQKDLSGLVMAAHYNAKAKTLNLLEKGHSAIVGKPVSFYSTHTEPFSGRIVSLCDKWINIDNGHCCIHRVSYAEIKCVRELDPQGLANALNSPLVHS